MRYRPEIDGLRSLAVIPVVLFHLGYGFINGGYYGVDVFFVISGFLITRILTQSIREQKFSMADFWIRRVKRLLPALLTVILVTLAVICALVFRPVVKDTLADVFPAMFSYFNFHALSHFGNYWGAKSNNSFFLHVWSLSVEEQFYIIYPFFLFFSFKYLKGFFWPLLVLTIISFLCFTLQVSNNREFAFYMLPARIWELSLGGLISLTAIKTSSRPALSAFLALSGIFLITISYFFGGEIISNVVILPTIGASLILLFATENNIIGKLLSGKLFVVTGKLSYSIYLWHWPVIVLFKNLDYQFHHINRHVINAGILTITFVLSYLTYSFIETKTRSYKRTPWIVFASILIISGLTVFLFKNFPSGYHSNFNQLTDYFRYYDISPKQAIPEKDNPIGYNMKMPNRPAEFSEAYKNEGIISRVNDKQPELILFGDSHGVMWARLIDELSAELKLSRSFYTSTASKPFFNLKDLNKQETNAFFSTEQRVDYAKSFYKNIRSWHPKLILLSCRWEGLTESDKTNLNELLAFLGKEKVKVVLINQPPRLTFMENKNAVQFFTYLGIENGTGYKYVDLYKNELVKSSNAYLQSLQLKHDFVSVYNVFDKMTETNKIKAIRNNDVLYYDDDHLSYQGTEESKVDIKNILIETFKSPASDF